MLFKSRFATSSIVFLVVLLFSSLALLAQAPAAADSKDASTSAAAPAKPQQADPLKRPLTEKQRKSNEKALKQELGKEYKHWLDEDVRWIVTGEELTAFKQLSNDEERDQFIEQFWLRRDPTPDTVENEFKEEHYRRIA